MFDLPALCAAVAAHGRVARVVIAAHDGSSPREVGAAMLVWTQGQDGTVGGGALEHQAVLRARSLLEQGGSDLARLPLGPALGQCCGGVVTLLTEVYDDRTLPRPAAVYARPAEARAPAGGAMPLAVRRLLADARGQGVLPASQLVQGWMVEPAAQPATRLWLWGAGHVGRAIAAAMAPLPDLEITWIDIAAERFPTCPLQRVHVLPAPDPAQAVVLAPSRAHHVIVTFSHALDLELCHRLLRHGFASCGLIGSDTKWARFRSRLAALGHAPDQIARIACPIGDPALGKHPQAIALGVASQVLRQVVACRTGAAQADVAGRQKGS